MTINGDICRRLNEFSKSVMIRYLNSCEFLGHDHDGPYTGERAHCPRCNLHGIATMVGPWRCIFEVMNTQVRDGVRG